MTDAIETLQNLHRRFHSETSGLPDDWQDWREEFRREIHTAIAALSATEGARTARLDLSVFDHEGDPRRNLIAKGWTPPGELSASGGEAVGDATFAEWLVTEMPEGTIIGDPAWWANRISRQYAKRCAPQPSAPIAVVVKRTECDCHPETCGCGDYMACINGRRIVTGSKENIEVIANAIRGCAQPSAPVVDDTIMPTKFRIPADAWESAQFMFGGPGTGPEEPFMDCTAWVGEIESDDGTKTYGLHIACDECPEEGSITLSKFPAPQPSAPVMDESSLLNAASDAWAKATYEWSRRSLDDRDEPREVFALRAVVKALTALQPSMSVVDDGLRDRVLGCLPAKIGNPKAWPPGFADGYNACAEIAHEEVHAAFVEITQQPAKANSSENTPACVRCGDSKQEFNYNGDGPYPCRYCCRTKANEPEGE